MGAHIMEVVVRGRLGPDIIAALQEFDVRSDDQGRTSIVGAVPDQSKLFGLLDLLDRLHIEVISVNPVDTAAQ
jgi:hypothetical protein